MQVGQPHLHHRRIDSTNERAKQLAEGGAPGGLVVTAEEQTAGRGRRGHDWFAPPGSALLYSALLRPFSSHASPLLPLAVPVAVCEAAEAVAPVRCQLKWPNDVWIDERKVAGILVEARPDDGWAVIGVGLNVAIPAEGFPAELRENATSLLPTEAEGGLPPGGAPGVRAALAALNDSLGRWLEASDDQVLQAFRARDALSGRQISWEGGAGVAKEVDERGHLVVETEGGDRVSLGAGEVHLGLTP
jgi:BirA family transcriptional regulator, biotin operon repressor / biotin---[acetyl-CoA-carboxylase] ligase